MLYDYWWAQTADDVMGSAKLKSFDSAFDAARDAWERVLPPRRRSYHKVYENERAMVGIEWTARAEE